MFFNSRSKKPRLFISSALCCSFSLFAFGQPLIKDSRVLSGITLSITTTNPTCDYNNGNFIVTASGGTPPYSYLSYVAQYSTFNGIFPNLSSGTYDIQVQDAAGNSATSSVTLTNTFARPYILNYTDINPTGCSTNDGSITVSGIYGIAPYSFSIDDGVTFQTSPTFNNLGAGNYYIFIKDANGCISAPWSPAGASYIDYKGTSGTSASYLQNSSCPIQLSIIPSGFSCGSINFLSFYGATGGTAPYTYSLDGINYSPLTLDGYYFLAPGHYTVFIKDATGVVTSYFNDFPKNCTVSADVHGTSCGQKDGSITVTNNNGIAPYTYSIDGNNFQTSNVFAGLTAGYYTVITKDVNGATDAGSFRVSSGCPSIIAVATVENCNQKNAVITAMGSGGNPSYSYSIDGINFQTNNVFTGLSAGSYTLTILDASGFTSSASVTIINDCMVVTVQSAAATCSNNNGQLTINALSGSAPYSYSLDGINFQSGNIFTNLAPGTYSITVKDLAGSTSTVTSNISNITGPLITTISQNASCLGNDGIVDISETGGTAPFSYSTDGTNFQSSPHFAGLTPGTVVATVKDNNGCLATQSSNISLTNNLFITPGVQPVICEGKTETLNVSSNGTSFSWTPAAGLSDPTTLDPVASPDSTTNYMVTTTTGTCSKTAPVSVVVNPAPLANAGTDNTICYGQSSQLNGTGGIKYNWTPSAYLDDPGISDPKVVQPTGNITYHLTTTDANGCISLNNATVNIIVTPPAKVFAGNDTSVLINQSVQLQASDINDAGFVQYQWTPSSGLNAANISNPIALITQDITYQVSATTTAGCEGTTTISIKAYSVSDIFVPNGFTPNGDGHNDILKALPIGIRHFQYFRVYNRWGQIIFQTSDASLGWDGIVNGKLQPTGTFVWMAAGINYQGQPIQRNGTVVLIR